MLDRTAEGGCPHVILPDNLKRDLGDRQPLPPIINVQEISKAFGANPLFQNVSFTVTDGDRIGLIGPNGSGKSTLLRILAGTEEPDSGEVAFRKRLRVSYVEQDSRFESGATVRSVAENAMERGAVHATERGTRFAETLGRAGFEDLDAEAAALSGGWQKRLAIVEALVQAPDILLLDEPTNHLDLEGIEWLEELLAQAAFASVIVSHDRYFLENIATDMAELSRVYPDGILRVRGNYSTFLEKKEEFLHAQSKRQEALENLVHNEIEWLRRGAKARTRKSKARISKAGQLMEDLADLNVRTRTATAQIDFSATERKTKRLIELEDVAYQIEGRALFDKLNFVITAGMRVGLVGPNGSGKTTLLRLLRGELTAGARRDSPGGVAAHRVLRPDPRARFECDPASRAGAGRRFGDLSGPGDSRGVVGGEIPVHRGATQSACGAAFRRRAGAGADRPTHASTGGCAAAG